MQIHEVKIKVTTEKIVTVKIEADSVIAAQTEVAATLAHGGLATGAVSDVKEVFEILGTNFVV